MDHHPDNWGRSRYDHVIQARSIKPITHTQSPIVTGTSVLAIRYKDGIMMAADCLGMFRSKSADILASYGSLARFRDLQRMTQLGETTLLGTSGDISDFQFTTNMLKQYHIEETCCDDGHVLSPRQWYTALSAYMYQRRSKMDPLWNTNIVAGVDKHTGEQYNPIHYGNI
jgi:20S proteasome subunit beta 7